MVDENYRAIFVYGGLPEKVREYFEAEGMSPVQAEKTLREYYKSGNTIEDFIKEHGLTLKTLCQGAFHDCNVNGRCKDICVVSGEYLEWVSGGGGK